MLVGIGYPFQEGFMFVLGFCLDISLTFRARPYLEVAQQPVSDIIFT